MKLITSGLPGNLCPMLNSREAHQCNKRSTPPAELGFGFNSSLIFLSGSEADSNQRLGVD
jgi:hypothetical protein